MAKNSLPTDPKKRKQELDRRFEQVQALQVVTSLSGDNDTKGAIVNLEPVLRAITRNEKRNRRVLITALAVAAAAVSGIVYIKRDTIAEAVKEKPTSMTVPSQIPLIDTRGNDVANAVTYKLDTDTQTRQLANGAGKALLVNVSLDTSEAYASTTLGQASQVCMPQSPEAIDKGCSPMSQDQCVSQATTSDVYCLPKGQLSADSLFAKFVSIKNTDNAWICTSEVAAIVNQIKTNPDIFENSNFSKEEIASASAQNPTFYSPYTDIPMPALHNDILLVAGDVQLIC